MSSRIELHALAHALFKQHSDHDIPFNAPGPYVSHVDAQLLLNWRAVQFRSFQGWMVIFAQLIVGVLDAIFLRFVVSVVQVDTRCKL